MYRFVLSVSIAITLSVTSYASGQRPGDFLMTNPYPEMVLAFEDAMPPMPQSTDVQEKNPWLAFGLSFLVTGVGQWYNGHYAKGTIQLVTATTGAVAFLSDSDDDNNVGNVGEIGALVWLGSVVWSLVDAPVSANRINRQARQTSLQINPMVKDDLVGAGLTLKF